MMSKHKKVPKVMIIAILALFFAGSSFFLLIAYSGGATNNQRDVLIVYNSEDQRFSESIGIDQDNFKITEISDTDAFPELSSTEVLIIYDALLASSKIGDITEFVNDGGALIIFMGQNLHSTPSLLSELEMISSTTFDKNTESMLFYSPDREHPLRRNLDWNSVPDIKNDSMSILSRDIISEDAEVILSAYPESKNLQIEDNLTPILIEKKHGNGNVLLFTGWLPGEVNVNFKVNPYFNYLLYSMILESNGEEFETYANWKYSPVPHLLEQIIILIIVILLVTLAIAMFLVVKKKSQTKMDPETLERIKKQAEQQELERLEERKELEKKLEQGEDLKEDWEVIGIHRQLGGFLFTLFIGLLLVIPQLIVSNFIMPQIIQPYPQAAGWWYFCYNLYQIIWILFDFGTSYALAKYFSQYRVKNPEKSVHYIQIFIWWQIFTGLIQVSILAFLGSLIYPNTNFAHMTWILITFSFVQYPGFFLVFMYTFQGMQRADLHLVSYVAWEVFFLLIGQLVFCSLGRMWGAANPVFGEALGAGIGYALARFFDYWMTFILTLVIFKKLGFSPKTVFRIDFTMDEFKETMKYGSRLGFGESFVQLGYFIQVIITSLFIANYSNELGYFNLVWNIGLIIQIVTLYGQSLLGAFSESYSHEKKSLTKLYIFQSFRWGNYFAFFLISVLFAVGAKFIIGAAGEDYGGPAVKFLVPLLIFHAFGVYSWLVDAVFQGTGKTQYAALVWIIEQATRAVLMIVLVLIFRNMVYVLIAYIPAVALKDFIGWLIVRKKITDFKIYPYKAFITPAIAAIINFLILFWVGEALWSINMGDKLINAAVIFITGIFLFIYFYAFLDGLLGGYDDNILKEFERASNMVTGAVGFFGKSLYYAAKAGTRLSPFHNKFGIDIYDDAMKEAYELTLEKKVLRI